MQKVELLAPAKDLAIAVTAIRNGADAVYIGAPAFGARKAAGNSLEDITTLVGYAHRFYCRVFVTLNTLLYDEELKEAEKLIWELYRIGVDALIVQDPGILQLDLPPIPLHASTQMHNYQPERIKFLDQLGFQRIVLARELSLEQIRKIRQEVKAELEVFIHGALCVSLSGQCYLSQYMYNRSANRGECAQPCRMKWSLKDGKGNWLAKEKYLLSLKDLNLSGYIGDLIDLGIDSFKIEGRLKDEKYAANVVNYYHSLIAKSIEKDPNKRRVGSGIVSASFVPDPERSFNRGHSTYFISGRRSGLVNMSTPKSLGKYIGKVGQVRGNEITVVSEETVHNGDGLCYLDLQGELRGIKVNTVEGEKIFCNEKPELKEGTLLYRNYDRCFNARLEKEKSIRKIRLSITARAQEGRLFLQATDEDGVEVTYLSEEVYEKARQATQKEAICRQLCKCGETDFMCISADYQGEEILFIPASAINQARRLLLQRLEAEREKLRPVLPWYPLQKTVKGPEVIDWRYNVVNEEAIEFYKSHGAGQWQKGFEKNPDIPEKVLMRTRYCLLYEIGKCRKQQKGKDLHFPLYLCNEKYRFRLEFDCKECFMEIRENN